MRRPVHTSRRRAGCASLLSVLVLLVTARTSAQGSWSPLAGPEGGPLRAIVIASSTPETIYAATSGGVFKRAFGTRWTGASTGLTDVEVQALAVDPNAPSTLYAATPSSVFKTTNAGVSWAPMNTGLPAGGVLAFAIDQFASATLYAGTGDGVYKTVDGGSSWQAANSITAGQRVPSLATDPFTPGTVYAAGGAAFYKSVDGGVTWTTSTAGLGPGSGVIELVAVNPYQPGALSITRRLPPIAGVTPLDVYGTTDGGGTWSSRGFGAQRITSMTAFAFDPTRPGPVYLATNRGVFRSGDGGATWLGPHSDLTPLLALAVDREVPWIVWGGADGGARRTDFSAISPTNSRLYWTFENAGLASGSAQRIEADALDPNGLYVLNAGALSMSRPDGSWTPIILPSKPWNVPTAIAADPSVPGTVYLGTSYATPTPVGMVLKSVDNGDSWTTISQNAYMGGVKAIAIDPVHHDTIYLLTTASVHKTTSAGATWFPVLRLTGAAEALAIDPLEPNTLYTAVGSTLFTSSNGGASWQSSTLPAGISTVGTIIVDPHVRGILYVMTEDGVFRSGDSGRTWTSRNAGLPAAEVTTLAMDRLSPSTLYAGTSGSGVFRTADGGDTWTAFNDGLPIRNITSLVVTRTQQVRIYAGLSGAGIYARTMPIPSLGAMTTQAPATYRSATGQWFSLRESAVMSTTFGDISQGDLPAPADYDGDGLRDIAVYRSSTGDWFVSRSSDGAVESHRFGAPGAAEVPLPADYDGDGRADLAIYQRSTRLWLIRSSANGQTRFVFFAGFGPTSGSDVPVPDDYDGDGRIDVALTRTGPGREEWSWYISESSTGRVRQGQYGIPRQGDIPSPHDYDGDGRADIAVYRETTGQWFIFGSTAGQLPPVQFGSPVHGDMPVAGDYDGDGRADIAVYRKDTGEWFWFGSSSGFSGAVTAGPPAPGDIPLTGVR